MRITFRFLLLLVPTLAMVVLGFSFAMQSLEHRWVKFDLGHRSRLISDSIQDQVISLASEKKSAALQKLLNRVSRDSRLQGLIVCGRSGELAGRSELAPKSEGCQGVAALAEREPEFIDFNGMELHRAVYPLIDEQGLRQGHLLAYHDPSYMAKRGRTTRIYALLAFLGLGLVIALVTVLVYRWSVSRPIEQISHAIRSVLSGDFSKLGKALEQPEFAPLVRNIDKVVRELRQARLGAADAPGGLWTAARLRQEVQRLFGDSRVCVVANREPYIHNRKGKAIEVQFPASGLVSAVEPIVRACSGIWIGHGSGSADKETSDKNGILLVPPGNPEYALKRVWLTREEEQGYYYGFSNEGLWPLCHIAHTRPSFRSEDWKAYQDVNTKFAQAFIEEIKSERPIALIQDYHFALLPGMLRKLRPDAVTSLFWHIPWPNSEAIGICPWKEELLLGMLGADLIGFHTQYHCNNFLDSVDRFLEARVDRDNFSVTIRGHTCVVKPFPISVEWPPRHDLAAAEIPKARAQLLEELSIAPDALVGIGVDRVDYTKGIIERFLAVERLLEKHPELVGRFVFLQIGAPSRTHIKRYQDLNSEVQEVTDRINWKFRKPGYEPIVLRLSHHDSQEVYRFYRAADVCIVSSLHDGMNLVAKEYISSRSDESGSLVLSSFTGAARELSDAIIVNPYDTDKTAEGIYHALTMRPEERQARMARLRQTVASNNVYAWAADFLKEIHSIAQRQSQRGGLIQRTRSAKGETA
ncbi:MAG: trehalose-6-phosphate synthase [Oligoflexia bacterium]|nr:trehalose-6-phosphate synthase [Oligoflexia bacterium]